MERWISTTIHVLFPRDVPRPSYGFVGPDRPEISHSDAIARHASDDRVSSLPKRLSDGVHARMRRLQAIDRQEARLDRPHRPAARRDPELMPVSRAAELLSRSPRRARFGSAATSQAGSMQELLARFEPCGNRSAIRVCGNEYGSRRFRDQWVYRGFPRSTPPCNNTNREP